MRRETGARHDTHCWTSCAGYRSSATPRSPVPLVMVVASASFLLLGCAACRAPAPGRDSPCGTVELFGLYGRQGDRSGQWDIMQPALVKLARDRGYAVAGPGSNYSGPDYRSMMRRIDRFLEAATVCRVQSTGNRARVLVRAACSSSAVESTIEMVRREKWRLWQVGQDEPYFGFLDDREFTARRNLDGSYRVGNDHYAATIPAEEVVAYRTSWAWYVSSLGDDLASIVLPRDVRARGP